MNILFISATRLGDAVMSTGLLKYLIERYPDAAITVACGTLPAEILGAAPRIERVIAIEKQSYGRHWLDVIRRLGLKRWDILVDLRDSPLYWLLPAKHRYRMAPPAESDPPRHKVEALAAVMGLGEGMAEPVPAPTLWFDIDTYRRAEELVPQGGPVLAVAPAANWRAKTWRARRFSETVAQLTAPGGILPGARVMVQAAEAERDQVAPVLAGIPAAQRLDLVGIPPILGAACIARADFFIGNDSGLMHCAAAAGVPTLGLFGPTDDRLYAPYGPHCRVVRTPKTMQQLLSVPGLNPANADTLMDGLTVEKTVAAAEELWRSLHPNAA